MMQTVPINIVGQSDASRSRQFSSQTCINLYPEVNPSGRNEAALMCWPGMKAFGSTATGHDRGMYVFRNQLYKVSGSYLYKINSTGAYTSIGYIGGGGRASFADDGFVMAIVADGIVYSYDETTFQVLSDPDFESPNSVSFLNNQWIYDGDRGNFVVSNVSQPGVIDGLNYASAEAIGDDLVRTYCFNQILYLFGEKSTESWYNSGTGNPPFERIEGGLIQKGIAAVHCITNTDKFVYFLADDRSVYRLSSYEVNSIMNSSLAHEFESYSVVSDCVFYSLKLEGQDFVVMDFPTENKTWCYSETVNFWFQLSSGANGGKHLATSYAYCYGKHLVAVDENINEWDLQTYSDLGLLQIKERIISQIDGKILNAPGKRVMINRFELIMQVGVGVPTWIGALQPSGEGSNPVVMFSLSPDGGESWGAEYQISIGAGGKYQTKVEWYHIESFYSGAIKIRFSDPVFVGVFSAAADIDLAGY